MNERRIIFNLKLHNLTFQNCDEVSQPKNLNEGEIEDWKNRTPGINPTNLFVFLRFPIFAI